MRPRIAPYAALLLALTGCAALPNSDPLNVSIAGVESLPSEGMELRLAVHVRVQNPNDAAIEFSGAAVTLDVNGRKFATGVSDQVGTVPRYGESVLTIAMTAPLLALVRQGLSFLTAGTSEEVRYEVKGKLEAGLFGTRRFSDEGTFTMRPPGAAESGAPL